MFCGNCGAENANGAKFCKECGQPLAGDAGKAPKMALPQGNSESNATSGAAKVDVSQMTDKIKALPKKVLIGVGAAVVALIVIICVAVNAGSTINLNDYLSFEAEGYDGFGTVRASVDWDAIEAKYGEKVSFKSSAKREVGELIKLVTPMDAIESSVSVKLEESSNLSNGTSIAYTWDVDEELFKYVKCKLKYKDASYTVSGLTEVGKFDAFADVTIDYAGIAPNGYANLNYTGSDINYYDFSCDKMEGLSNGDKIKVTIDESRLENYAKKIGKVPEVLEKEFTVEGLSSYLSQISEINDESLTQMQQQAEDVYSAHVAKNWGEGEKLESLTYIGEYLLTIKNKEVTWGNVNVLYLVYKAQVRDTFSNDEEKYDKVNDIYWYISFSNIMVEPDGSLTVEMTNYSTPYDRFTIDSGVSNGWWGTKSWNYYGYESIDELFKNTVAVNMDSYNHEDNIDESAVPAVVAAADEEEEEEVTTENGYIFPNSDKELLKESDLEGLTADECKIARNEIYARHGRKFKDEELQAYFNACDWYEGTIDPDDFKESDLSDIEIANKDLIVSYEEEKGYR